MESGLDHLLTEGIISEVVARLQSGKEADVFVVRYGSQVVVAKVYKDRAHRSFKNNAAYKEGRTVRNTRSQRAINRGTKFGQAAAEDAWKSAEVEALYKLHAAGVRVPTPVIFLEGVLLMELVRGADGDAARRLIETPLTPPEANAAYRDMLGQLVRMLSCDLIHGDLSPYNVLWGVAGPTIIDFPQIISAAHNSSSESFFLRDARNILGHFAAIDRSLDARSGDAAEIWRAYARRELTPEFLPVGRPAPSMPRPRSEPEVARAHAPARGAAPPRQDPPRREPHGRDRGPRRPPEPRTGGPRPPAPRPQGGGGPRPPQGQGGAPRAPGGPRSPGGAPRSQPGGAPRAARAPEVIVLARRPSPVVVQPRESTDNRPAAGPETAKLAAPPRRRRRAR